MPSRPPAVAHDAIVLAGGRSSRMPGVDKVGLVVGGRPLLAHACAAVEAARRLVVVGPEGLAGTPAAATVVREDPPFAGPAAAIGAGMAALQTDPSPFVAVLAADVPRAAEAVPVLLAAAAGTDADGVVARSSDGHRQPLLAVYRSAALRDALDAHAPLTDRGVGQVTRGMHLVEVDVPDDVLADIDSPTDLERLTEEGT
ncbi:molybdenum cofactor guanylyltransferase [Aeromicrobium chenweiae]|uniref:Molybdopterin-guanine dinucleotide biosynthesis protein n=1 Tax=Aeromicrobium chenweiae TaxID=2079793 RepID=A0A2S0WN27_9ACTN|nr:NTP transferase domain-containing protein [Aeromicrobium chenweiae]AWB92735.1 molybdopterin-guanine dinucleotide biosynthesis protein [Aeromicrobium chenweiae]TGN33726.1 molybdopterin-guanine dinucleotide biosynthesis protein [Aeromicrobium chenweiae]